MSRKFIISDMDLDGAMSYLLFKWYYKEPIPHKTCSITRFQEWFPAWYAKYSDSYDEIYILDLDVSQDHLELTDKDKVIIIDHHKSHVNNKSKYKKAKGQIVEESSCAKLIYNILSKDKNFKLDQYQQLLVALVDDYDSYTLTIPQSRQLNIVYWNFQNRLEKFETFFGYGFKGFTPDQQRYIKYHEAKVRETIKNAPHYVYEGKLFNKQFKIVAAFASNYINDVADHLIKDHGADCAIVVNPETDKVSMRRGHDDFDLLKFTNHFFEEGGGHEYATGAKISENFVTFTKLFQEI
jgi:nanoRNase/pAp phosphatase (c-di-AMP/oligoRNAs hydrolase)